MLLSRASVLRSKQPERFGLPDHEALCFTDSIINLQNEYNALLWYAILFKHLPQGFSEQYVKGLLILNRFDIICPSSTPRIVPLLRLRRVGMWCYLVESQPVVPVALYLLLSSF